MTHAQHTPGPWKASAWIVYAGENRVATAAHVGLKGEADARLIAEAPAMLEALRVTLYWLDMQEDATKDAQRPHMDRIRAILARIEGAGA